MVEVGVMKQFVFCWVDHNDNLRKSHDVLGFTVVSAAYSYFDVLPAELVDEHDLIKYFTTIGLQLVVVKIP